MLTLADLRDLVYRDLGEPNTANDRVTVDEINRVLDQGYRLVAAKSRCFVRTANIQAVTGQSLYALPADMFAFRDVFYGDNDQPLVKTSIDKLAMRNPGWRKAPGGTPTHVYLHDSRKFGLFVKPTVSEITFITMEGFVIPSTLTDTDCVSPLNADTKAPEFSPTFHEILSHYAVWMLASRFLADEEAAAAKAAQAAEDFKGVLADMVTFYQSGLNLA